MMNPYTGEVLAMATEPTFDLNNPALVSPAMRRNRAITDCYEPGSTFKIIAATAALEEGLISHDTRFDCSAGSIEVGGRKIRDAHRMGVITFKEVIQKSSNVGTIKIGLSLGREGLQLHQEVWFWRKNRIRPEGEASGLIRPPGRWSGMSIGAVAIGQEVAVTPMQVLRAIRLSPTRVSCQAPRLLEVISPEGKAIQKENNESQRILSEKTVMIFKDILKTVTEEGGTATGVQLTATKLPGKPGLHN